MDEFSNESSTRRDVWVRALLMLFFLVAYSVAELVIWVVVVLQLLMVLITGRANENLLILGNNLSAYVYQIFRFQTFNSERQAFPFADWPNESVAEDNVWNHVEAEDHSQSRP